MLGTQQAALDFQSLLVQGFRLCVLALKPVDSCTGGRVLGSDHPSILLGIGNLAQTLVCQRKLQEAETLQREALDRRSRILGPDHPETQFAIANLALVLLAQKRYAQAEQLYRQALEGEIKVLGENHREIAYAWYNLATVEAAQKKRAIAVSDLHRAIDHGYSDTEEIAQDERWGRCAKTPDISRPSPG